MQIDPVLVRVAAVVLAVMSFGTSILLYLLLALIIPLEPVQSLETRAKDDIVTR
jgi:phage shock protein PspC (stress-responsive transcriptional regulator)